MRKKKNYFNYICWNGGMLSASLNVHIPYILSKNKKNCILKSRFNFACFWKLNTHLWNVTWNDVGPLSPVMSLACTYSPVEVVLTILYWKKKKNAKMQNTLPTTIFHHNQFQSSNFVFISFQSSKFQVCLIKASLSNFVICWG